MALPVAGNARPAQRALQVLQGSRLGEFWKCRVGDYRLICKIEDDRFYPPTVQREVISELAGYHESQKAWAGKAFLDRRLRFGGHFDLRIFSLALTTRACILLADVLNAFKVSRNILDLPAFLAADLFAFHATARTDQLFRAQHRFVC